MVTPDFNGNQEQRAAAMAYVLYEAGFEAEQIPIMVAIGLAESSGHPGALNPDRSTGDESYGLWQINMIDNLGPARLKQFGIDRYEDLYDPLTNALAAKALWDERGDPTHWSTYKRGEHRPFMQIGERIARSASRPDSATNPDGTPSYITPPGQGTTGNKNPYQPPPQYTGGANSGLPTDELPHMPMSAGGGTNIMASSFQNTGVDRSKMTDDELNEELRQSYPQYAWALVDPELGPMLRDAAREEWTDQRLNAELMATDWWQASSDAERRNQILKESDPATWSRQQKAITEQIRTYVDAVGLNFTEVMIQDVANQAHKYDWDQNQIRAAVTSRIGNFEEEDLAGEKLRGEVAENYVRMQQISRDYMIPLDDQSRADWLKRIIRGDQSVEGFQEYASSIAVAMNPWMERFVAQGLTPQQAFTPYRNQIASTLDMDPNAIDPMDDRYMNLVTDENGNVRPLADVRKQTRLVHNDRWQKTAGAKQAAHNLTTSIATMWGKR